MCAAPGGTMSVVGVNMNFAFPFPLPVALMKRLTFRVTLASIPTTWSALVPARVERPAASPKRCSRTAWD